MSEETGLWGEHSGGGEAGKESRKETMQISADETVSKKRSRKRKAGDDDPETVYSQQHSLAGNVGDEMDDRVARMVENVEFGVNVGRMDPYTPPVATGSTDAASALATTSRSTGPSEQEWKSVPPDPLVNMIQSFRVNKEQRPLKIVRASYQYMYDNTNSQYLDCLNSVCHVGHCHPAVVKAASEVMERDVTCLAWDIDHGDLTYEDQLRQTLPDHIDTFLFCNSGSEAVDLALQLSTLYTSGTDAVVTDNAFHGSIDSVHQLSPKIFKANNTSKADWVHIVAMPDLYRGQYQRPDPEAVDKYLSDAREVIENIGHSGRKLACFIAEPMLTVPGMVFPPAAWLQEIYKMVREAGGLCIADEVQAGLGRVGSHFWSFQAQGVNPDIIIIGKSLGNGYPMASVATSRDIAAVLGDRIKEYQCSPVMDAVGCAVLEVVQGEHLMAAAASVGALLRDQLTCLQHKHDYIGDVRGCGLMIGLEMVWSKQSKKPAQEVAEHVVHKMKEEYVIIANEGCNCNILMLMPPMCFTQDNALHLVQRLDKVLSQLPTHRYQLQLQDSAQAFCVPRMRRPLTSEGRLGIIQPQEDDDDDSLANRDMELEYPKHNYQDLD